MNLYSRMQMTMRTHLCFDLGITFLRSIRCLPYVPPARNLRTVVVVVVTAWEVGVAYRWREGVLHSSRVFGLT